MPKLTQLSPLEVRRLRAKLLKEAENAITALSQVAAGYDGMKGPVANARVNAARVILNKVVPDLSNTYREHLEHTDKDVHLLTKAQLQALIAENSPDRGVIEAEITKDINGLEPDTVQFLPKTCPPSPLESEDEPHNSAPDRGGEGALSPSGPSAAG